MDTSSKQDDPGYTILLAVFNIAAYIVEPLLFFLFNHENFTNAMVFFTKLLLTYRLLQFFLMGSQDLIWIVYLCAFADSIVSQFFNPAQTAIIPMLTLLQTRVANDYQGRIFGALIAIQAIALLIGMSMAGGLGDSIGIVPMLLIDASFNILASLLAFALIHVPLQQAQLPAETSPLAGQLREQGVPML